MLNLMKINFQMHTKKKIVFENAHTNSIQLPLIKMGIWCKTAAQNVWTFFVYQIISHVNFSFRIFSFSQIDVKCKHAVFVDGSDFVHLIQ